MRRPNRASRIMRRALALRWIAVVLILAVSVKAQDAVAGERQFAVQFPSSVRSTPYSGRVYLFFTRGGFDPRRGPNWFRPEPFIARDVRNLKPGELVIFRETDKNLLAFPKPLKEMDLTGTRVQAVIRFNPWERRVGDGPGNGYSRVAPLPDGDPMLTLVVDQIVPMRQYTETALRKEFRVRSKLLSDFHRRDVFLKAGIYLPESYATNPGKRYPTIYVIPGFGGDHYPGVSERVLSGPAPDGVEFLGVLLNPNCPEGHHVFADSANNGPVGRAFVEEFLPAFDRKFRTIGDPRARYLTGHSSGGWSSLWLQITHPDDFGGTWSTSPDPVDFRDFQRIDIYRPNQNVYFDEQGNQRPLARFASRPVLFFRSFDQMELTLGHGGQLRSFEAVFSPRGNDGQPLSLWSRQSGAINGDVARAWQKYDIRLVLERNWPKLRSKLQGKLHVFTGDADTFYLDGATRLLKQSLASLQSDAIVELHQGTDHFTLLDSAMLQRIRSEMAARFRATFERPGSR